MSLGLAALPGGGGKGCPKEGTNEKMKKMDNDKVRVSQCN
jgi:hypothetical protein